MNVNRSIKQAVVEAPPWKLRQLAAVCCRLLIERYPDEWPEKIFREEEGHPGGHVSPKDWPGRILLEAAQIAEALSTSDAGAIDLRPAYAKAKIAAKDCYDAFCWANHKLGDSATGAEFEVGFVAWQAASAARECCADKINGSIGACIEHTIEALAFRWNESEKPVALRAERDAMAERIRKIL
jgi:hypothetical protein